MRTFDELIALLEMRSRTPGRFRELCRHAFGSVEGAELMAMLCTMEHPMDHSWRQDPREASHHAGRREVVAALWRYSSSINSVPVLPDAAE